MEIGTGKVTLFAPKTELVMRIFQSPLRKADLTKKYGVPTMYASKMEQFITNLHPVSPLSPLNLLGRHLSARRPEPHVGESDPASDPPVALEISVLPALIEA
jgi:hypothetical protein